MARILKYLAWAVGILAIFVIVEYAHQGFINDLSIQPLNQYSAPDLEAPEPTGRPPVFLVTYAAGGEVYFRNQNAVAQYALNKGVDFILNYRKSHIDQKFFEKNRSIFNEKVGAGMWLWKPYIILRTLESAPDDSIIIYVDASFKIRKPISRFLEQMGQDDILLVQDQDRLNGAFVKGDTFQFLNCKDDSCRQSPHLWSALIVVRNSPRSRAFIKAWLDACENEKALNATPYHQMPNYPEFKWHQFDQSVLSLIYHKYPDGIKILKEQDVNPYFIWFRRKSGRSSQNKIWYTLYGTEPLIDFSRGYKNLPSTALLNLPPVVWIRKQFTKKWDVGG